MLSTTTHLYDGSDLEAMAPARRYRRWIAAHFAPYLARAVVEVGAGDGRFAEVLLESGAERLHCLEPAERPRERLVRRLGGREGVRISGGTLAEVGDQIGGSADAVVYVNVLEHVDDDREELRLARGALRPGGHLCLFVPANPALFGRYDARIGHHRRYRRAELRRSVEESGYRIVHLRAFDLPGALAWLVAIRLLGGELTAPRVARYDRWVIPLTRRLEAFVPPPFGKNLICIARAP